MPINIRGTAVIATMLMTMAVASCDSNKKTPAPISGPTTVTPPVVITRIELIAPASMPPGTSVQMTLNAVKSDSSVENVTAQAQWFSSDPRVLEVSASGLATAKIVGEATIRAQYRAMSGTRLTVVVPQGTFRLAGTVNDSGVPLPGATVAIIAGVGEGLTTTTDGSGRYALYGVAGRVRLHAKREGYSNLVEELDVTDNRAFDFEMKLDRARADLSGNYTLTFIRAACTNNVPDRRAYQATVMQNGPRLEVRLSGADFVITNQHGNAFTGVMDGTDRVTLTINGAYTYYYYYGAYDIVERLTDSSVFIVDGRGSGSISSGRISGTLNGEFIVAQGSVGPFTRVTAYCYNTAHGFEMVRR